MNRLDRYVLGPFCILLGVLVTVVLINAKGVTLYWQLAIFAVGSIALSLLHEKVVR